MKRRIISILLSVIMVVAFLPLAVFAEENSFTFCGQTVKYSGAALTWSGTEGESDAILTFTNTEENGSLTLSADVTAWILAVGGGGGGGGAYKLGFSGNYGGGGGGGAGGFIDQSIAFDAASYTITVGAGGAGGKKGSSNSADCSGSDGESTVISKGSEALVTALGGGGGGSQSAGHTSESGEVGSGGGGSMKSSGAVVNAGGKGTAGQGKDGGAGDKGMYGGGGGGAGTAGADASTENPVGGDGLKSNITGTEKWYAGGGGGSHSDKTIINPTAQIAGGKGGGGKGGVGKGSGASAMSPTDGENGTGGGGGGCDATTTGTGGNGGSGIVVIRLKKETEKIHSHDVECPDCSETVCDPALTKCPKCGADLENSAMSFTAWDKSDSLPYEAGNYYLTSDVTLSANWSVNADINLCLNGFNIIRNGGNTVTVNNGGTLSIYDCSKTQHKFTENNGLWVLDEINGTNLITGGCIMGVNPGAGDTDGIGVFINGGGTFNLYGGNIAGNYASKAGGGVMVCEGAVFNMYGGSITGNKADENGGGVYAAGTFTMYGGNIVGNTSTQNGGGVYVSGRFDMIDGSIIGNTAVNGGGISNDNGKFTMVGGRIADNSATNGGGIYTAFLAINVLTGGIITENSATVGGGLYAKEEMCFAAGTMITMADGTKKAVETLNIGEVVRVFDHENGEVSTAPLFDAWQYPEKHSGVVTLHFTDDIDVTVVGGHSFFSRNENKYVAVTKDNVNYYVGHEFYNVDDARWETLIGYDFIDGEVDTYILTSEKHLNCVANGMLTNEDGFYTTVTNIFEYGDGLKIDAAKKADDIEKYGLWDFENMKYASRETYDVLNLKYMSVAFGKGLITPEAFAYLEAYWCGVDPELLCRTEEKAEKVTAKSGFFAMPEKMLLAASPVALPTTPGVYVGGTLQIIENDAGNLYLSNGKAITLGTMTSESDGNGVAAPTEDFSVGVTMQTPGKFTTNGTADEVKYFTSDNSAYIVTLAEDESGLALSPVIKFTKTQAQWEDKAAGKWNLGIVGTFNTNDIPIDFYDNGTSKNVTAVGVIVSAGEHYEQETTRFVYATENENEYCYRAVIKNIPYNVSSDKTITVQFFATVDGKDVLGETKVINLADAYTTAINNGMPPYEG